MIPAIDLRDVFSSTEPVWWNASITRCGFVRPPMRWQMIQFEPRTAGL